MTRPVPHLLMTKPSPTPPGRSTSRPDLTAAPAVNPPVGELIVKPHSNVWRRRVGPLAWAALEDLALATHHSEQGWVAPVGVRDIAAASGSPKTPPPEPSPPWAGPDWSSLGASKHHTAGGAPATASISPTGLSYEPAPPVQTRLHHSPTSRVPLQTAPVPTGKTAPVPRRTTPPTTVLMGTTGGSPGGTGSDRCPTRLDNPGPAEGRPRSRRPGVRR